VLTVASVSASMLHTANVQSVLDASLSGSAPWSEAEAAGEVDVRNTRLYFTEAVEEKASRKSNPDVMETLAVVEHNLQDVKEGILEKSKPPPGSSASATDANIMETLAGVQHELQDVKEGMQDEKGPTAIPMPARHGDETQNEVKKEYTSPALWKMITELRVELIAIKEEMRIEHAENVRCKEKHGDDALSETTEKRPYGAVEEGSSHEVVKVGVPLEYEVEDLVPAPPSDESVEPSTTEPEEEEEEEEEPSDESVEPLITEQEEEEEPSDESVESLITEQEEEALHKAQKALQAKAVKLADEEDHLAQVAVALRHKQEAMEMQLAKSQKDLAEQNEKETKLLKMESTLAQERAALERIELEVKDKKEETAQAEAAISAREQLMKRLEGNLQTLQDELKVKAEKLEAQEEDASKESKILAERDLKVAADEKELAQRKNELEEKERDLARREALLKQQENSLTASEQVVANTLALSAEQEPAAAASAEQEPAAAEPAAEEVDAEEAEEIDAMANISAVAGGGDMP